MKSSESSSFSGGATKSSNEFSHLLFRMNTTLLVHLTCSTRAYIKNKKLTIANYQTTHKIQTNNIRNERKGINLVK
jgi:hypothetical protein